MCNLLLNYTNCSNRSKKFFSTADEVNRLSIITSIEDFIQH